MDVQFKKVSVETTLPLRHKILRPHQTLDDCQYDGDLLDSSMHLAAISQDVVIGCISLYLSDNEVITQHLPNQKMMQFRAMATDECVRGKGIAKTLLQRAIEHCASAGCDILWCHARETAKGFYAKQGFYALGEPYLIPGIGPHSLMYKTV